MNYGTLFIGALLFLGGLWMFRDGIKQLRLNKYLREHGVCTSAAITYATERGVKYTIYFTVTYQDEQHHMYDAHFSTDDSDAEYSHVVGGEVLIYYDPLRPERSTLAEGVNSPWHSYLLILTGVGLFALGVYLPWKLSL